jgi:hypothetical protein
VGVRLRLGPFSISSRGRVGARVGPVSISGGGYRRRRKSPGRTRQPVQIGQSRSTVRRPAPALFTSTSRSTDAELLQSWLASPPARLELPGRFTQTWFSANAGNIHPLQVQTLLDELASRGWSREDIDRRAMPHLERVATERESLLDWHAKTKRRLAAEHEIVMERKAAATRAARERDAAAERQSAQRRASRAARRHAIRTFPLRSWRRILQRHTATGPR